jgi:chemotaxis-related protein WspB
MLALMFEAGGERLALDTRSVAEVVPRVRLRSLAGAPGWLAGVFIYRGRAIPVVDLCHLADAGECPTHLSSRIILVRRSSPRGEWLLGILAARVDEVRTIGPTAATLSGFTSDEAADLGAVIVEEGELIRQIDLDHLLPESYQRLIPMDLRELPP